MLVIDATPSGQLSNCYLTLTEAEIYFESKFHKDDWINLSEEDKTLLLVDATRLIETSYLFNGKKTVSTQFLQCPQLGLYDCGGNEYASDEVPQQLKNAVCEQALYLASTNTTSVQDLEYVKAGVGRNAVAVEYNLDYKKQQFSNDVINYLKCIAKTNVDDDMINRLVLRG